MHLLTLLLDGPYGGARSLFYCCLDLTPPTRTRTRTTVVIQSQTTQKPVLRGEVGARALCNPVGRGRGLRAAADGTYKRTRRDVVERALWIGMWRHVCSMKRETNERRNAHGKDDEQAPWKGGNVIRHAEARSGLS